MGKTNTSKTKKKTIIEEEGEDDYTMNDAVDDKEYRDSLVLKADVVDEIYNLLADIEQEVGDLASIVTDMKLSMKRTMNAVKFIRQELKRNKKA